MTNSENDLYATENALLQSERVIPLLRTYPFIRMVLSYLFAAVLISLVLATLVHYLYGGLRMQGRRPRVTMAAQAHLFVLFGVFVLLKAVAYWVDRYGIDFSQRGAVTTGASYTDVNAVLPAKTVLSVIAVLCALLFFAGAARVHSWFNTGGGHRRSCGGLAP